MLMRIYLRLSPNKEKVPFDYQRSLVGAFHRWLGENELHDDISLYSLSWLHGGRMSRDKKSLDFRNGAEFFISSPLPNLHQKTVAGIFNGQHIRWGMHVKEVRLFPTPKFGTQQRFLVKTPVLIKRKIDSHKQSQYYFPHDTEANDLLTETLQHKLNRFGLDAKATVRFDNSYNRPQIKKVQYNQLGIKATICPVIVAGDARAVQFAWEVGVGNSTGIGFGALG